MIRDAVGVDDHKAFAPAPSQVRVFAITASDSRTTDTNQGGRLMKELATGAGFAIAGEALVPDDREEIARTVARIVHDGGVDAILITGGTGIAHRDTTVEAVAGLLEKRIDGYGELFRMLSFAEIGPAAMLSRAIAGTVSGVVLFLMPGSPAGVRLAMERLIIPELPHLVGELRRGGHPHGHHRA